MHRQENTYERLDLARVELTIHAKNTVKCVFNSAIYAEVRLYKWSHRGKGVIVNEFGETFASFVAELYGFEQGWTRNVANSDYTEANYTYRDLVAHQTGMERTIYNTALAGSYDAMGIPNHPRIKYKNKYECVEVTLPHVTLNKTYTIQVNKFCAQYLPSKIRIKDGVPVCADGTPVKLRLLEALNVEYNPRKYRRYTIIENEFDLRIDPNDMTYIGASMDRIRFHFFVEEETGEELCVVECQDNTRSYNARFPWLHGSIEDQWRTPITATQNSPRVAYCLLDADIAERVDDLWWDDHNGDWRVRDSESNVIDPDTQLIKPEPLKRVVARSAGHKLNNIYIHPRYKAHYKSAMEIEADLTTQEGIRAARRRAKYENALSTGSGNNGMFTKPKYIARRKVVANKVYFCTQIYGGVGVYCADLRRESILVPGLKNPGKDDVLTTAKFEEA